MTGEAPCAGCLGSRECWVCEGTGAADTRVGVVVCASCQGSRACQYCDGAERRS